MADDARLSPDATLAAIEQYFGKPVQKLTAPGGRGRTSFRAYFRDGSTLIVSQRQTRNQHDIESHSLETLSPRTDAVPGFLGSTDKLLFQADVGQQRLNHVIHSCPADQRPALARQAVAALLDIHRAANQAGLAATLPRKLEPARNLNTLVKVVRDLSTGLSTDTSSFHRRALHPWFHDQPTQFIKWDCRAGNAALDLNGTLRWFDFEAARVAHGPEDLAWLIADETWPLSLEQMLEIVRDELQPENAADPTAYMAYLEQFTALHALRRIQIIIREANKHGWMPRRKYLKYDMVGVDPRLGRRLSAMGDTLAARHDALQPLRPLFRATDRLFQMALDEGKSE